MLGFAKVSMVLLNRDDFKKEGHKKREAALLPLPFIDWYV
jgi:hypothetical protein